MDFSDLRLSEPILRAVVAEGYTHPHADSDQGDPARDARPWTCSVAPRRVPARRPPLPCRSWTASARHRRSTGAGCARFAVLILAPTRELAAQIHDSFRSYGRFTPLRQAVIFGGVNQNPQARALKAGIDIVVATPGRLLDLMEQKLVDLRQVEVLVLDEADRMLDMGFIHDIRKIVAQVPRERQTLLFSATMAGRHSRIGGRDSAQPG